MKIQKSALEHLCQALTEHADAILAETGNLAVSSLLLAAKQAIRAMATKLFPPEEAPAPAAEVAPKENTQE